MKKIKLNRPIKQIILAVLFVGGCLKCFDVITSYAYAGVFVYGALAYIAADLFKIRIPIRQKEETELGGVLGYKPSNEKQA